MSNHHSMATWNGATQSLTSMPRMKCYITMSQGLRRLCMLTEACEQSLPHLSQV